MRTFFRPACESNLVIGTGGSHEHRPTNNAQGPFRWSGLPTLEQPGTGTGAGSEGRTRQRHVGRRSPLAASPAQCTRVPITPRRRGGDCHSADQVPELAPPPSGIAPNNANITPRPGTVPGSFSSLSRNRVKFSQVAGETKRWKLQPRDESYWSPPRGMLSEPETLALHKLVGALERCLGAPGPFPFHLT